MGGSQKIKRHLIDNFNGNVTKLADGGGQVRRSRNGCIYVTKAGSKNQYIITAPDEATPTVTLTQTMTDANFSYDRPMMNQPVSIYTKEENLFTREAGEKHYELTDHLGNVRVVISDVKLNRDTAGGPNSFIADVKAVYNYLPFGFPTPGRNYFGANAYRWGFNGKENDNEVYGSTGTFQDYGMRMYDTRIARFISVDTMFRQYPMLSPYQFASLSPIQGIDLDGNELKKVVHHLDQHSDKSLFIKSSSVTIDQNITFKDKEGKEYAKTEVYLELGITTFSTPASEFYEPTQKEAGGLKPSASYDYTKETIPNKAKEDIEYIKTGKSGFMITRFFETLFRDLLAPENKALEDITEGLEVITTQ